MQQFEDLGVEQITAFQSFLKSHKNSMVFRSIEALIGNFQVEYF